MLERNNDILVGAKLEIVGNDARVVLLVKVSSDPLFVLEKSLAHLDLVIVCTALLQPLKVP